MAPKNSRLHRFALLHDRHYSTLDPLTCPCRPASHPTWTSRPLDISRTRSDTYTYISSRQSSILSTCTRKSWAMSSFHQGTRSATLLFSCTSTLKFFPYPRARSTSPSPSLHIDPSFPTAPSRSSVAAAFEHLP